MDEEPLAITDNELRPLVVPLLKGVVYRNADQNRWLALLREQGHLRTYVHVLGLELFVDEAEGYAFLRTPPSLDGDTTDEALPRLVSRRRLTFGVSLLLALLRKRLAEADAQGGEKLVLTRTEIAELGAVFQPSSTNEAKVVDRVEADINKVVELGFLHPMQARAKRGEEPTYEIRRVLKAFVDAQWMSDFDARLAEYRHNAVASQSDGSVEPAEDGIDDD